MSSGSVPAGQNFDAAPMPFFLNVAYTDFEDRIATVLEMVETDITSDRALLSLLDHLCDFAKGSYR